MYNPFLENDDLIAAVIRLWSESSSLVARSKEKQRDLATTIIQTFDSLQMSDDDFRNVISEVGEDSEFASVYYELCGVEEEKYDDGYDDMEYYMGDE